MKVMKETLDRLIQIEAPVCVTLVLNTHKTRPDNQKDSILLKNLITEANQRLQNEFDADTAKRYTEKLQKIADDIDHNHNDLSMLVFVNDDVAEFLRLPIRVHDRVIIDDTFATRPILRALKREANYYVLVLSKGKARLIQASGESAVKEFDDQGFPVSDSEILRFTADEGSNAQRVTNLTQEFFNGVDKAVNEIRKENPLPIVVYSEGTNFHSYMKEADAPNTIYGHVVLQNFDDKPGNLVKNHIWPQISELRVTRNRERISELEKAMGSGKVLTEMNDIWRALQEGRGRTLFVEEGHFQAVKNDDGHLTPIEFEEISSKDDIDDIVDEMIENSVKFGGDVVFAAPGSLKKFNKLALITRY